MPLVVTAHSIARNTALSVAPGVIALRVLVMVAPSWSHCRFDKFQYCPEDAQMDYRTTLIDSRQGVNLTVQEAKSMASVISPLLKQGHSPYQILANHPELNISEKTLYNYIESGVFRELAGITPLDLRRQVSRKLPKKKAQVYKKRKDNKYLKRQNVSGLQNIHF